MSEETSPSDPGCLGVVSVRMPCELGYLRVVRQNVRDFAERAGMGEDRIGQLEMAVDEASANIIEHSYGRKAEGVAAPAHPGLHLTMSHYPDRVVVELKDFGRGFNYAETQSIGPDTYLAGKRQRGLGLFIIRTFVDEADYRTHATEGNLLRLVKKL
jgi:anti-sigma regulatory factor (Ser/Thr protein kinase)